MLFRHYIRLALHQLIIVEALLRSSGRYRQRVVVTIRDLGRCDWSVVHRGNPTTLLFTS